MSQIKDEAALRAKLAEILEIDGGADLPGFPAGSSMWVKVTAAKILLWALGENDDDRWHINAMPGPPLDKRARDRN